MQLVVTIPAYNEEKSIAQVIAEIPRAIKGVSWVKVLVIDDGSSDGTVERARQAGADRIVCHLQNQGLGVTFRDALEVALEMGADIVVNLDADGQYNPQEIPKVVEPILEKRADIVLGWRDIDKLDFMPKRKKLGNKVATWVTRMLSDFPVKDAQTGFRAFSREAALKMNLSGRYTYTQETIFQAKYKRLLIEQVRIEFMERRGDSRLISNIAAYALKAGGIIFNFYKEYQPLRLFLPVGAILVAIGLAFGVRVIAHYANTGAVSPYVPSAIVASLLITVGLLTIIFGLFADMFKSQRVLQDEILYRLKKAKRPELW